FESLLAQIARNDRCVFHSADRVVGIDQQRAETRKKLDEVLEGLTFSVVRHDVAMRHRAVERDSITAARQDVGSANKAREATGTRRHQTGIGTVAAPEP